MTQRKQTNRLTNWLPILAICLFIFTAFPVVAQNTVSEISTNEALYIKGSVRKVAAEKNTIFVKVSQGEKFQLLVAPQTDFVGISSLADLQKGQQVKVWYSLVGEEKRAVKLELLPDLGC